MTPPFPFFHLHLDIRLLIYVHIIRNEEPPSPQPDFTSISTDPFWPAIPIPSIHPHYYHGHTCIPRKLLHISKLFATEIHGVFTHHAALGITSHFASTLIPSLRAGWGDPTLAHRVRKLHLEKFKITLLLDCSSTSNTSGWKALNLADTMAGFHTLFPNLVDVTVIPRFSFGSHIRRTVDAHAHALSAIDDVYGIAQAFHTTSSMPCTVHIPADDIINALVKGFMELARFVKRFSIKSAEVRLKTTDLKMEVTMTCGCSSSNAPRTSLIWDPKILLVFPGGEEAELLIGEREWWHGRRELGGGEGWLVGYVMQGIRD